jgi:hypothetical protein
MEKIRECCNKAKFDDGFDFDNSSPISGVHSRLAVMAALHFDFCLAMQIFSDAESTDSKFGEKETNKKIFGNVLNSFRDIEMKQKPDLIQSLVGTVDQKV